MASEVALESGRRIYFNIYEHPYIRACFEGELEKIVNEFIKAPEELKGFGLRVVCGRGHLEPCKFIIESGVDISFDNYICFRQACFNGHLEIIQYLYSLGVPIEVLDNDPLKMAFMGGKIEVMKWLMENGAKIDKEKYIKNTKMESMKKFLESTKDD